MLTGKYSAKYIGKTICGFKNNHEYIIDIGKDRYCYSVKEIVDLTEDKDDRKAYITYASEISIRQNWNIHEDITEL